MLLYADNIFSDVKPNENGGTDGDHIRALKAMGAIQETDEPEIPKQLEYLFNLFMDMRFSIIPSDDKFSRMAQPSLTYSEIYHHSLLTGLELHKFEIQAIMSLNSIFDKYSN